MAQFLLKKKMRGISGYHMRVWYTTLGIGHERDVKQKLEYQDRDCDTFKIFRSRERHRSRSRFFDIEILGDTDLDSPKTLLDRSLIHRVVKLRSY